LKAAIQCRIRRLQFPSDAGSHQHADAFRLMGRSSPSDKHLFHLDP
jgi:hypothetical protein